MGVCVVATLAVTGIYHWVDNTVHVALFHVMDFIANVNALLAIWVLLSAQSIYHEHLHRLQHKAHVEAKLLTLQNQLNPHFLFNSLNTLNQLIDINTNDAKKFLHNIAHVLRYTLNNKQITTLQNELNVAKHYNQLLNTRFHHRLQVHYNVSEALLQTNIPTLTLLTLVENAIKHNAATDELPLHIHIETVNHNLVVSNNINQPKTITSSTGLGLKSLKERTKLQLNTNLIVSTQNNTFKVTIPLNNKSKL
jgi:LytS/YehU family sensor histidine kinase